jgi:hypothetical protein
MHDTFRLFAGSGRTKIAWEYGPGTERARDKCP